MFAIIVIGFFTGRTLPGNIGHPGWKEAGGRTTYSLAADVVIALMCFGGLFGLLGALIPLPAIVPILLYIGLLIGAQAFISVPKAHAVAVVMAVIPNVAAWATGQIDNVLNAAGTSATKVGSDALAQAGVVYDGLKNLGGGAILAGMVLGAITVFMIDKRYYWAVGYCVAGAVLSFIGLIHGEQVTWQPAPAPPSGTSSQRWSAWRSPSAAHQNRGDARRARSGRRRTNAVTTALVSAPAV